VAVVATLGLKECPIAGSGGTRTADPCLAILIGGRLLAFRASSEGHLLLLPRLGGLSTKSKTQIESQRRVGRKPSGKESEKSLGIATFSGVLVVGGLYVANMGMGEKQDIVIPASADPELMSVDERQELILLLEAGRTRLDQYFVEAVGVFDELKDYDVLGFPSTVAFLKHQCRMSGARAKRSTLLARAARRFRQTFLSWKHNQISSDEAQLLFQTAERMPDRFPNAEPVLLEIVGDSYDETRKLLDYWRQTVDKPGVLVDEQTQMDRRRLDISRKANGMVEGEFALPQLAGETFLTAIDALMPPPAEGDGRTPSQRRADALEDLSRAFLEGTETPEAGGEKPHVNIHVDLDAVDDNPGGLHETESGTVLTLTTVRQLACDSSVSRIVWNAESEIVDVGRKTRVIPAATRRALIARDRHCVMAGCTRNPRWCDAHHIIHWADGGNTNLDNLCLLCRYHHTLVHQNPTYELALLETVDLVGTQRPT